MLWANPWSFSPLLRSSLGLTGLIYVSTIQTSKKAYWNWKYWFKKLEQTSFRGLILMKRVSSAVMAHKMDEWLINISCSWLLIPVNNPKYNMVQMPNEMMRNIHDWVANGCPKKYSTDVKVGIVWEYHKTHKTSQLPRVNCTKRCMSKLIERKIRNRLTAFKIVEGW